MICHPSLPFFPGFSNPDGPLTSVVGGASSLEELSLISKDVGLHPHLIPLAHRDDRYICALRSAASDGQLNDVDGGRLLPIVETSVGVNNVGMRLLGLNSEHLMRRIAATADEMGLEELIDLYNSNLGTGLYGGLDAKYEVGSVKALGYGLEKFCLLRIGPFPDLYESISRQHAERGDESSALIACETMHNKFPGWGQTFSFYASMLQTFKNRGEEVRDAAQVCLRLPLSSCAITDDELANVARLAQLADVSHSTTEAIAKMAVRYEKIIEHEQEEAKKSDSGKTDQQIAMDRAQYLLDTTAMTQGANWASIREMLGDIYENAGKPETAKFVNPR
eukprot:CAMPEP_0113311556 /NCGR_PEP_ID=MMETSP0010_2-20120614/8747_1 /TAXON_ID=216773 ORGANISM="Corethron hystrix, Strain 308" /NCGR_SAMPLE_ID=MMETSP0010_2 /ASSEMBLY_ACC=CAM_ASM_000155 /LENGTH=334 /DNA_ID=CAMNT_0000167221 /DNA_START=155 /DNA_END=1159 /DNA_ORIENTATION=- /assembly_acc=CAM_ASM_000155